MTINERWRICFEFREGCAYEVEIAARRFILALRGASSMASHAALSAGCSHDQAGT
jgi:hypothetical protein